MIKNISILNSLKRKIMNLQSFSTVNKLSHDITICGGGVVGSLLAALILHKSSGKCNIGIIDSMIPSEKIRTKDDEIPDMRVYALSPFSIKVLKEIGAWKYIEPRSQPYTTMQIWETNHPGYLRLNSFDLEGIPGDNNNGGNTSDDKVLGCICEDKTIQTAIYQSIKDRDYSMTTYYNSIISDINIPDHDNYIYKPALVKIKSNSTNIVNEISSRLIVGADGGQSTVRRLGGFSTWGWTYDQEAIVATVQIIDKDKQQSHYYIDNATAWQKYLPTGPLALLPLWDGYASIVWSTSISEAKRLKGLSKELFLEELNTILQGNSYTSTHQNRNSIDNPMIPPFIQNIINTEIRGIKDIIVAATQMNDAIKLPPRIIKINSSLISFPLSFSQSKPYVKQRCVLVGDAAHSIHPQAGQGLNLGIQDVVSLSSTIISSLQVGNDIGDMQQTLLAFERDRAFNNLAMMSIVDIINGIFKDRPIQSDNPLKNLFQIKLNEFRTLGLLSIHNMKPLKQKIASFAMGLQNISKEFNK